MSRDATGCDIRTPCVAARDVIVRAAVRDVFVVPDVRRDDTELRTLVVRGCDVVIRAVVIFAFVPFRATFTPSRVAATAPPHAKIAHKIQIGYRDIITIK